MNDWRERFGFEDHNYSRWAVFAATCGYVLALCAIIGLWVIT